MQVKYRNFVLYSLLFSLKLFVTVFVSFKSLLHVIIESSIILSKYLPFSQLHLAGF